MAKKDEEEGTQSSGRLLDLVEKDLRSLAKHWMGVSRDYAFLTLPKKYSAQLPTDGGTFYRLYILLVLSPSSLPMLHRYTCFGL